ncbi:TPA: BspA family leucine-rich repeat surface protein, partial [Campylobacter coli]|nr:BspA family leucine-rich repeat surface protein [Campylobacter coli]
MQDLDSQLLKAIDDLRKSNVSEWEAKKAVVLELFDKGASIPQDTLDKLEVYLSDLEQEYWDDKAVYAGRSIKDSDEYNLFNILSRLNAAKSKKKSLDGLFKITKSKGVRHTPKDKDELVELVEDKNIYLGDIDISNITNFKNLFKKSKRKDFGGIETWDVSKVTNMDSCFENARYFNHNIQSWNVSKVKSMESMFYGCKNFNQPLDKWNVSNVTDMGAMFKGFENFNGDLSKWDVSKVTGMGSMFEGCKNFNGDLSKWDVSKVTGMGSMFEGCKN